MLPRSKYSKFFDLIHEQSEIIATCKSCEYKKKLKNAQASKSSLRHHLSKHPEEMEELLKYEESENKNKLLKKPKSSKYKSLKKSLKEVVSEQQKRAKRKLKKEEYEEEEEDDDDDDEMTTKPQTSEISHWDRGGIMTKRIDEAIIQMICTDIFPLSITDGIGFKNFLKVVAPKYVPKSRWTITRSHLPALYDKIRSGIINQLEDIKYISITTDTWEGDSNNNNTTKKETNNDHSLISVTAHFINKEMEPTFAVLAARSIKPETNTNVLLSKIFEEFKIEEKIHVILRGGAMESSAGHLLNGCHSIWCQAHILNLAVTDGFKQIDGFNEIINRVKDFIKRLRKSANLLRDFHQINSFLEISEKELVKGNEIRWNSCFDMLNLLVLNINAVNMLSMDNEKLPFFSLSDWTLIQNLTKILKPIYNATTFLQKRTSSVGYIIPLMKAIELDLILQPVVLEFPRVRAAIVNGIKCRMGGWEDEANLIIPTLLDPYFKMTLFPVEKHLQYKDWLIYEIQKQCPPLIVHQDEFGSISSTSTTNESNPFKRVKNYLAGNTSIVSESISPPIIDERFQIFAEVDDYLSRPTETEFHDVYSYWKNKVIQQKYPHLTELFAKFCCAPATSLESERLFSTVNTTLSAMRKGLNGEHLEQLVFCRHNILINGFFD